MDPQSALLFVLFGIVTPFVLSLGLTLLIWRHAPGIEPASAQPRQLLRRFLNALLAPGAVLLLAQSILHGVPSIPPREALHILPWMLIAGLLFGTIELRWLSPTWASTFLGAVALGLLAGAVSASAWVMPAVLIFAGGWSALRGLAFTRTTPTALIPLGMFAAGTAVVLVATGNLKLAQLAAACAMSLLAILCIALTRPRLSLAGPILAVTLAWLAGLLGQGMAYGDTPRAAGYAFGIGAPVLALLIHRLSVRLLRGRVQNLHPALGGAAILALAILIALLSQGESLPAYEG
jgi:hypothetical protein